MGVSVCRLNFKDAVGQFQDGNVERAAAQVVDGDCLFLVLVLVKAKGERGGSRLVDDALYIKAGDFSGVLRCLALAVVKVGRNRDYSFGDFASKVVLGGLFHLLQDEGRNFLGAELLLGAVVGDLDAAVGSVVDDFVRKLGGLAGQLAVAVADKALD